MAEYDYEKLKKAGAITQQALEFSKTLVKEGAKLLDVVDKIESFIKEKGGLLSFPVNISINSEAAHYTPTVNDEKVFTNKDLVKIDAGARIEEYLGDGALTIDLSGENGKMIEASVEALGEAVKLVRHGRPVREIGKEIETIVKKHGFIPIKNLGGHLIEKDELHAGIFIPNYDDGNESILEEGTVIAIEPFITTMGASGYVADGEVVQIFQKQYIGDAGLRTNEVREVSKYIDDNYKTYPFALRWLIPKFGEFKARRALQGFMSLQALEKFPVLVEKSNSLVAQAEKEVIVEGDSYTVVTK